MPGDTTAVLQLKGTAVMAPAGINQDDHMGRIIVRHRHERWLIPSLLGMNIKTVCRVPEKE